jgi:hypothetical protein
MPPGQFQVQADMSGDLAKVPLSHWFLWALLCSLLVSIYNFISPEIMTSLKSTGVLPLKVAAHLAAYLRNTFFTMVMGCGLVIALGRGKEVSLVITALTCGLSGLVITWGVTLLPFHSFWLDVIHPAKKVLWDTQLAFRWSLTPLATVTLLGGAVGVGVALPAKNGQLLIKCTLAGLLAGVCQWIIDAGLFTLGVEVVKSISALQMTGAKAASLYRAFALILTCTAWLATFLYGTLLIMFSKLFLGLGTKGQPENFST